MGTLITRDSEKGLMMRAADGTQNEVTADNHQNDAFFTSPIQIGTPAQTLPVVFDSGSADTWVWSSYLPLDILKAGTEAGNAVFNPAASETFNPLEGHTWNIQYGDKSTTSGIVGTDILRLGDIVVENQAIECANNLSAQFARNFGSGLLGLSFGKINAVTPTPVKTPIENMIEQRDILGEQQLFTCHLGSFKDAQDLDKGNSFYTFGSIDEDVIKASGQEIHSTPVDNSEGFWMFDSATATVNGKSVSLPGGRAMADTGTTLIMASNELCEAVYSQINGAVVQDDLGGWVFPAEIPTDKLPQVTLDIGGKQFNIEKENLAFAPADKAGTMMFGGIQPRGNLPFSIYGDTLLTGLYAIFDVGKKRFGCVQRMDPTPSGTDGPVKKLKSPIDEAGEQIKHHAT